LLAARVIGVRPAAHRARAHPPNVLGPIVVIGTINLALRDPHRGDVELPRHRRAADHASLGSLVRIGNEFLFSGDWWISAVPERYWCCWSLAVNLLGDWLRDALNPRLSG